MANLSMLGCLGLMASGGLLTLALLCWIIGRNVSRDGEMGCLEQALALIMALAGFALLFLVFWPR